LEFGNVVFEERGVPQEKGLEASAKTNNKINKHMALSLGIEPLFWRVTTFPIYPQL